MYEQPSFSGQVKLVGHTWGTSGAGIGVVEVSLEMTATPTTLALMTGSVKSQPKSRDAILGLSRIEGVFEVAVTVHVACSIASRGRGAYPNATCQR